MTVEVRVDELLEERGRSYYWLSKETGISHTTLWRLKKGKALGINFATLDICRAPALSIYHMRDMLYTKYILRLTHIACPA